MKNLYVLCFLSAFCFLTHSAPGQEVILNPDGIFLPQVADANKPAQTTPGHLIFNLNTNRAELFSQNFIWEGLLGNKLIDEDLDSEITLNEGLTQGSPDFIEFKTDNLLRMTLSSNSAYLLGDLETEDGTIFMRNLGSTDTDQGVKWGEGNNDPIFGLVYDGEGNGANSELHLREYNLTDSDVISFKANGNVKVHNLSGTAPAPVFADNDGNLTRNSGMQYVSIGAMKFTPRRVNDEILARPYDQFLNRVRIHGPLRMGAPVDIPHGAIIKEIKVWVNLSGNVNLSIKLIKAHYDANNRYLTTLMSYVAPDYNEEVRPNEELVLSNSLNHKVDNNQCNYLIEIYDANPCCEDPEDVDRGVLMITIGYQYE